MKKILTAFLAVAFVVSLVAGLSASSDNPAFTQSKDASIINPYDGTTNMLSSGYGFHKMTTNDTYDGFTWSNELRVNSVDAANTEKAYWGVSFSEAGNDYIGYWFADKKFKVVVDGVTLVEKDFDWQLLENKWYDIMIRKFGDTVTLYCDNVEMVTASSDVFDGKWKLSFSNDAIDIDIGCIGIFMGEDFNIFDRENWKEDPDTKKKREFKYYNFADSSSELYIGLPEKEAAINENNVYLSRFEEDFTLAAEGDYVVSDIGYLNFTWADYGTYYHTGSEYTTVYAGYWFDSQKAGITYNLKENLFGDSSTYPSQSNASYAWKEGETHNLAVRREGATLSVLIDGNVIVSYNNPGFFDRPITAKEDGGIFFWSRYLSYQMDNLVLKNLATGKELINLDFSEDLVDPETGKELNTKEDIELLFINKQDYGNGLPGLLTKPANPEADGVNRYVEYDSYATNRDNYRRKLYLNPRTASTVTDFEASMDVTITKVASANYEGEAYSGTPAGIGFSIPAIPADSADGYKSAEGTKYNLQDHTFSADLMIKDAIDLGFTDHEKHPEDGGRFYFLIGGTAEKGYGAYELGYDIKKKEFFVQWSWGDLETPAIDPVPFDWPLDEWVTFSYRIHTVEDEYGAIPELILYINGQEILSFQEENLVVAGKDIGEPVDGALYFRKFDIQMAISNIVVTDGSADINSDVFKIGCKANGHVWDDGVVTLDATTKAEGAKLYTCQNCAQTKTEVLAKLSETPVDPGNNNGNNGGSNGGNSSDDPSKPNGGGSKKDDNKANPGTSDADVYAISSITALLGGIAVAAKKKMF